MSIKNIAGPRGRSKAALIAAALVAGAMTSVTPAAAADEPAPLTPQTYIAWLRLQNSAESNEVARQFRLLPATDQQKFLGYLVDEKVAKAGEDIRADTDPDPEARSLVNGDVTFEVETGATGPTDRGSAGDWRCYYDFKQKIFGITVTKLKLEQWYRSSSTKVTKVYNAAASKRNYNPGVSISNEPEEQWISAAGNALAYVTWHGDITASGLTVQVDKRQHIRCDETGGRYQYMKNI
ncbi:hypothetical protein ACFY3G_19130 [Streptomyces phaeochromogenes]|uniref:hypothetical protein n=1 Tax=Streptomyces phaeochromogenes TaxID=1923 RepID=UPI00367E676A